MPIELQRARCQDVAGSRPWQRQKLAHLPRRLGHLHLSLMRQHCGHAPAAPQPRLELPCASVRVLALQERETCKGAKPGGFPALQPILLVGIKLLVCKLELKRWLMQTCCSFVEVNPNHGMN
jgi:hypothetical protein